MTKILNNYCLQFSDLRWKSVIKIQRFIYKQLVVYLGRRERWVGLGWGGVVCRGVIHSVSATSASTAVAWFMAPVFTVWSRVYMKWRPLPFHSRNTALHLDSIPLGRVRLSTSSLDCLEQHWCGRLCLVQLSSFRPGCIRDILLTI